MSKTSKLGCHLLLVSLQLVGVGWSLSDILAVRSAEAQTFMGVQGDRNRITLAFQVKSDRATLFGARLAACGSATPMFFPRGARCLKIPTEL